MRPMPAPLPMPTPMPTPKLVEFAIWNPTFGCTAGRATVTNASTAGCFEASGGDIQELWVELVKLDEFTRRK